MEEYEKIGRVTWVREVGESVHARVREGGWVGEMWEGDVSESRREGAEEGRSESESDRDTDEHIDGRQTDYEQKERDTGRQRREEGWGGWGWVGRWVG
jgi:hypothetical protein